MLSTPQETEPRLLYLVPYEHPILRKPTQTVAFPLSKEDAEIIRAMKYSIQEPQLKKAKAPWDAASGMAANQWGIDRRIFLFCPEATDQVEVIINPSYEPLTPQTTTEEKTHQDECWEGCFSVPWATGNVQRYTHIRVRYQDESGQHHSRDLSGWQARVWQHENDHLNGFLYDDPKAGKCLEKHSFDSKEALEAFYQAKKEQAIKEGKRSAKKTSSQKLCPCGRPNVYTECCGAYLEKSAYPKIPEDLMRSRYSAYNLNNMDYIRATMRGPALALFSKKNKKSAKYSSVEWLGLEVLKSYLDPNNAAIGYVEFVARYKEQDMEKQIHELSTFHLEDGRWYYVEGKHFP